MSKRLFTLETGKRYRARIDVPWYERAAADEGVISRMLTEAGFESVAVVKDEKEAGRYWAWGSWTRASDTAEMPSEISDVAEV